jgi:hypothetical protein
LLPHPAALGKLMGSAAKGQTAFLQKCFKYESCGTECGSGLGEMGMVPGSVANVRLFAFE